MANSSRPSILNSSILSIIEATGAFATPQNRATSPIAAENLGFKPKIPQPNSRKWSL